MSLGGFYHFQLHITGLLKENFVCCHIAADSYLLQKNGGTDRSNRILVENQ
jgi:hypothetical protein